MLVGAMRLVEEIDVIDAGGAKASPVVSQALSEVRLAIGAVVWPPEASSFTIHPEKHGNGVGPIKLAFIASLLDQGWLQENPFPVAGVLGGAAFGPLDVAKVIDQDIVAIEWETGNISSSHRAMNKMAIGLRRGVLFAGVLIVPTKDMASFLTDRIGNVYELRSYVEHWHSVPVKTGYLGIWAIEHDGKSRDVPIIPKATDGRALR